MKKNKSHPSSGFSLLEFIVVIFILSILLIISVPSFVGTRNNMIVSRYIYSLKNVIHQARVMAVALNAKLVIAPIKDNNYSLGMVLYSDIYNKKNYIIKINKAPENIELSYHGFPSSSEIIFDATDGFWASNGSFKLKIKDYPENILIKINKGGYLHWFFIIIFFNLFNINTWAHAFMVVWYAILKWMVFLNN